MFLLNHMLNPHPQDPEECSWVFWNISNKNNPKKKRVKNGQINPKFSQLSSPTSLFRFSQRQMDAFQWTPWILGDLDYGPFP